MHDGSLPRWTATASRSMYQDHQWRRRWCQIHHQRETVRQVRRRSRGHRVADRYWRRNACRVQLIRRNSLFDVLASLSFRVDRSKYQIHLPLPPKIDPSVTMMQVEEKPDVTYSDVGGCKEQIEKLREVVELPLLHVRSKIQSSMTSAVHSFPLSLSRALILAGEIRQFGYRTTERCPPLRTTRHWKNPLCSSCGQQVSRPCILRRIYRR